MISLVGHDQEATIINEITEEVLPTQHIWFERHFNFFLKQRLRTQNVLKTETRDTKWIQKNLFVVLKYKIALTSVFTSQSISQLLDGPHCNAGCRMRELHYFGANQQSPADDQ